MPSRRRAFRLSLPAAIGIAALLAVCSDHAVSFADYVNDDAYITFRYGRTLASGGGPYFNPGEHVEGYTNPLLMVAMAAVYGVLGAGAVPVAAKALGLLAGLGSVVAAFALGRRLTAALEVPDPWIDAAALLAAGFVAAAPGFAVNSESGLETVPFAFLLIAAVLAGVGPADGRWRGSGVLFAAAYLMRPEGVVAFAVFWVASVVARGWPRARNGLADDDDAPPLREALRPLWIDAVIVTFVVAMHLWVRHRLYDSEWLPNTYYAKAGGDPQRPGWRYVLDGAALPFLGWWGVALAAAGLVRSRGRGWRILAPVAALALVGTALPVILGADWMAGYRFLIPYLPLLATVVAAGLVSAAAAIPRLRASRMAAVLTVAATLGAAWMLQDGIREQMREATRLRATGYRTGHRALAQWLAHEAHPGDTIALMDVGLVGYTCIDQRILDLTGLTDRAIGKSPGTFLSKRYDPTLVLARRPQYVVIVLVAPGESYTVPIHPLVLRPFTAGEAGLLHDPLFQSVYARPRPPAPTADWHDVVAAEVGAERVFEHGHPGQYYLLAVFRRHDPAITAARPPSFAQPAVAAWDTRRTTSWSEAPGRKTSATPSFLSSGMSWAGMMPPTNTWIPSRPFSRTSSRTRRQMARWAPERIDSPIASTSSWAAAATICSGLWRRPV